MAEREILDKIQRLEIAEMFIELPSRTEYPDYYQIIKHPIALQDMRIKLGPLYSLADLKSDFDQMVQNAFTYNIKGSAVYANAQALDLKFNELYDIASFQQQLLETIDALKALISIPSFIKLESLKKGIKLIKSQVDLEKELHKLDIDSKDKQIIKKHLETISSDIYVDQGSHSNIGEPLDELTVARISYKIGDFCYVSSKIVQIFEIWKNDDGTKVFRGCWFPYFKDTVHKSNAKYFEREVFKSNSFSNYLPSEITGKCYVLFLQDYVRGKPRGAHRDHLYLCGTKYDIEKQSFQKIRSWKQCMPESIRNEEIELEEYETPLLLNSIYLGEEQQNIGSKRKRDHRESVGDEPFSKRAAAFSAPRAKLAFFVPSEQDRKPFSIRDENGVIQWFPSPPLAILKEKQFEHSTEYLAYLKKQKSLKKSPVKPKESISIERNKGAIDVDMQVAEPESSIVASDKDLGVALSVISPVVQASSKQYNRDKSNYGDVHVAREYLKNKFVSENEQIELNDKKDHFYFFSIHDYNRDHSLDGHELRLALSGYEFEHTKGHESSFVPEAELEDVIDHVLSEDDKDNDGKISWEEYLESQAYHNDFS